MNEQDIEVNLKLLEEKQKLLESRLGDVDECCGKLKGIINAEMRVVNERIVAIEQGMDTNCKDFQIEMKTLQQQTENNSCEITETKVTDDKLFDKIDKLDEKLDKKISKITSYYMTFSLGILISMGVSLVALIR